MTPKSIFISLLKEGKNKKAIKYALMLLTKEQRALYLIEMLPKSRFRSYRLAIDNFTDDVKDYLSNGKSSKLRMVFNHDSSDEVYNDFISVKNHITTDLCLTNEKHYFNALMITIFSTRDVFIGYEDHDHYPPNIDDSNDLRDLAVELACFLWPNDVALKVLYGS